MSNESDGPKPKHDDKKSDSKPAAKKAEPAGPPPALDERKLKYGELLQHATSFDPAELVAMLPDGRAIVRANAALALAAANQASPELVTLLRDSEGSVALDADGHVVAHGLTGR